MSHDALLRKATAILADAGIDDAVREARILWRATSDENADTYLAKIAARATRQPLSQVLGYRDFYKHRFAVTSDVLDPRPDTETLIEVALRTPASRILDLGTGSGCILVSLLAEWPAAQGLGTDVSHAALAVAARNATDIGVQDRTVFVQSDWFENVTGTFDLIVSNPPYIALDEMTELQPEVRLFEPRGALTDGADGLSAYRIIAAHAGAYLADGGRLIFEIGPTQAADVAGLMTAAGFETVQVIPDIDGRDRVVWGEKPRNPST